MKFFIMMVALISVVMIGKTLMAVNIETPLDVAAIPDDATVMASGLGYKILEEGTSDITPKPFSKVTVHYSGWTTDGKLFDSSVKRGAPSTFPLNQVINGWREGLVMMKEGEKRRLWIPGALAYEGKRGPQGMLVFDVELIAIVNENTSKSSNGR